MNIINIVLLIATLVSGFVVVNVQNQSRLNFIALNKAQKQEVQLEEGYSRLKLEQAELSNHKRIKSAAEDQYLQPPTIHNTVIVR